MNTRLYSIINLAFIIIITIGNQVCKAQWMPQNSGTNEQLNNVVKFHSSIAIAVGEHASIFSINNGERIWNNQS